MEMNIKYTDEVKEQMKVKENRFERLSGMVGKMLMDMFGEMTIQPALRLPPKDYGTPRAKISEDAEKYINNRRLERNMKRVERYSRANPNTNSVPRHIFEKAMEINQYFQQKD